MIWWFEEVWAGGGGGGGELFNPVGDKFMQYKRKAFTKLIFFHLSIYDSHLSSFASVK